MSRDYSANQYQNAFVPNKLQNWEVPLKHRENNWKNLQHSKKLFDQYPRTRSGQTTIIGTDRGHLMGGIERSSENPWGNFVGTWDLPSKVPGNTARVTTARATRAADRLVRDADSANVIISGTQKNEDRQTIRAQGRSHLPPAAASSHHSAPATPQKAASSSPKALTPPTKSLLTPPGSAARKGGPMAASPAPAATRYPEPDVSRRSPATDSPVCIPAGQRSPTPPQRSPLPNRNGEQVPVAL